MKKHLYIYAVLVLAFIIYNFFFQIKDERTNTAVNILLSSVIFGYLGWLAFVLLRRLGQKK